MTRASAFIQILRIPGFWPLALRLVLISLVMLAILVTALTAFLILLPIAVIGGVALTFYVRRRLRRAAARHPAVIEADYTVIER